MTTAHGLPEPITTDDAAVDRDGLEHWLQDIRAELSNDPPGWLGGDTAGEPESGQSESGQSDSGEPVVGAARADQEGDEPVPSSPTVGRHRA